MMYKSLKTICILPVIICIAFLIHLNAYAAPAAGILQELTQPSGEKLQAAVQGDESFNWVETKEGDVIAKDNNGYWCYAQTVSSEVKAGNKRLHIDPAPAKTLKSKDIIGLKKENASFRPAKALKAGIQQNGKVIRTTQKILVLLVQFRNVSIRNSDETWSSELFNNDANSVASYYSEVSGGGFHLVPQEETSGTVNDGVIKVTLSYNHPNTGGNLGYINETVVADALRSASPYIDFAADDTNNDGYISEDELHIITILAGYEAAYSSGNSPSVWGHRGSLEAPVTINGEIIGDRSYGGYMQIGEMHADHMASIGIICHELGHDLGLPDLYDTDQSSQGIGVHSLMAAGNWNCTTGYPGSCPAHLDAWSKVFLGFASPTVVSGTSTVDLKSIATTQYNVVKIPTSIPTEYFLLENRQFEDYDAGLSDYCINGGIAIWHIDENVINARMVSNSVNNDEAHKGIDLEEANEGKLGHSQLDRNEVPYKGYDHYYCLQNNTTFGPDSRPGSRLYSGADSSITVVTAVAGSDVMKADITIGTSPIAIGDVNGDASVDIVDALLVLKFDAGMITLTDSQKTVGDVNHDGNVDISDAVLILKYDAGLIINF